MFSAIRFFQTPKFIPLVFPQLLWRINTAQKKLYLTFDDGPVPGPTEFVLEVLRQYKVKATFFCIGDNVQKLPDVFGRLLEEGHSVGNHTFHHVNGWKTDPVHYEREITACDRIIEKKMSKPTLFRPPYGKITPRQVKSLFNQGKRIVMWDVLTYDFDRVLSAQSCLQRSVSATRAGSVVVFHDSFKAEQNLKYALPRYIETMLSQNFEFEVLSAQL
jgi:peptidoglycan/xylan/chitin deacetylase (PgdA/CDA1 family)